MSNDNVVFGTTVGMLLDFPHSVDFEAKERGLICSRVSCVLTLLVIVEVVAVVLVEVEEVVVNAVQTAVVVVAVVGVEGQARVIGVEARGELPRTEAVANSP